MSGNRKPIRAFLLRRVFPPIALWIYRRWGGSWRYVTENEQVLTDLLRGPRPLVGAFLHGLTVGSAAVDLGRQGARGIEDHQVALIEEAGELGEVGVHQ